MKYALIRRHEGEHAIALMCGLRSVSRSGYYEWRGRPTPPRMEADEGLLQEIQRLTDDHKGRTGSPRIRVSVVLGKDQVSTLPRLGQTLDKPPGSSRIGSSYLCLGHGALAGRGKTALTLRYAESSSRRFLRQITTRYFIRKCKKRVPSERWL